MEEGSSCVACGRPLANGRCRACDRAAPVAVHREIVVLVALAIVLVAGVLLTRAAARASRELRLRDAAAWYGRGQQALAAGRREAAVTELRRATALDRENHAYRFTLAQALAADQQDAAARRVLLALRESTPEDPEVNLQLARLESRHDDLLAATRYYENALYGLWSGDQAERRRQVNVELVRYLLAHEQRGRALSELLVLAANLPDDVAAQIEVGQLFLELGEPRRGLERFRQALGLEPSNDAARAGAGEAAFALGDYALAQRHLEGLSVYPGRTAELRQIAGWVIARDPLRPGLPLEERRARLLLDLDRVRQRLTDCLATRLDLDQGRRTALEYLETEIAGLEPSLERRRLQRKPEAVEAGLRLIARIEQQADASCGDPSPLDRALRLIARRHDSDVS